MFAVSSRRVLPGFTLSLGTSLLFVCLILLLPLSALVMQLAQMSWARYLGGDHQPAGSSGLQSNAVSVCGIDF